MKFRVAALAGVVLATALGGASLAAPPKKIKPVCNLVLDLPGDATWQGGKPKSLDITGGDVVSDGKDITFIVKFSDWADPDQQAPLGRKWVFTFAAPNSPLPLYVMAWQDHGPNTLGTVLFNYGRINGKTETGAPRFEQGGSGLKGKLDVPRKQIRIHVPANAFNSFGTALKAGSVISGMTIQSFAASNPGVLGVQAVHNWSTDTAQSGAKYSLGYPSCEKVNL